MLVKQPIYNVCIMRGKNIEKTIVFGGTGPSNTRINHDDTISQIKAKIVNELMNYGDTPDGNTPDGNTPDGNTPDGKIEPNQIYLCAETNNQINISNINLSNGETSFRQLLTNLEIDMSQIEASASFDLQDILNTGIKHGDTRPITIGLGMTLTPFDYVFPANPMYIVPGLSISKYIDSINYSGNSIFMNAGPIIDNNIYVYFAEDVLTYTREIGIPDGDVLQIYFPEYKNDPVKHMTPQVIEFLYDTYYNSSKLALKYQERGIHQYDITLFSKSRALFSLDAIFKNIHSTRDWPFIRYKPGIRRDPIYRLYSTSSTKSGKRIPVLSYRKITSLINGSANYKHISIYNDTHNIFINIENDGTIRIQGKVMRTTIEDNRGEKDKKQVPATASIRELDFLLDQTVNPFLKMLDNYLSKSGYKVPFFTSLNSSSIKINNLSYSTTFDMKTQFKLNNGCAFALFDIADATKEKIVLRYKRVDNFKKMDAQSALISEVYKKSASETEVIEALMKNYGMSNKDAILRLLEYQENLNYMKGKHNNRGVERTNMFESIKNPGFLTTIEERKKGEEKREIKIVVHNLNNIKYIETIGIYIDSLVRLSITDDPTLVEKCNVAIQEEEEANAEVAEAEAEAVAEPVVKAQPVDINKLLMQFEERDAMREVESEDEIDLDEFLESDDEEELSETEFLESDDEDEDEDLSGGAPGDDDDLEGIEEGAEEGAESEYNTTSKSKKVFIHKLKEHDPKLFSFTQTKSGQFKHYTRVCQSMLQPVVLTQEEKDKIDKDYRGSYTEAVEYGSSPENKNWYICPRFWCFKTNTSMTKKDIDAGKCGTTAAEKKKNVFEFNAPKEHMKSGEYVKHFPGFKTDIHPDGYCLPCCFSEWDTQLHRDRRDQCMGKASTKTAAPAPTKPDNLYIIGADKTQVDPGRWGFAQYAVQYFLQIDYANHISKTNSSAIRDKTTTILRYGIRQETITQANGNMMESRNRSIVAAFADIYARVNKIRTPSVPEFLKIIANTISIDEFVQYGNGIYISLFDDGIRTDDDDFVEVDAYFVESSVYRFLDMKNKDHYNFFRKLRRAYERFLVFLEDPESVIDHKYFWDIVATPGLFRYGLNLVLMEITNNDVTENIDIICPTSSYSANQFAVGRESVFMIKTNDIYLPLYKYTLNGKDEPNVEPLFVEKDFPSIYKIMASTIENYCKPRASITKKYGTQDGSVVFKQPMALFKLLEEIRGLNTYTIEQQVWNYQGKIVYLVLRSSVSGNTVVVPCLPAAPVPEVIPATFMDDIRIYSDYDTTKRELEELARLNPNILCKPVVKVFEDGLVVGIITETNQLVRIKAPQADVKDSLVPLGEENYVFYRDMAKTVETADGGDEERARVVRNVELEAEFYALFRTTLKSVLESAPNRLKEISGALRNKNISLDKMTDIVRKIMEPAIIFGENQMPDELLDDIYKTGRLCQLTGDKHIGMLTESQQCIFPKYNLVTPERDNSVEYFVRIADELLRYGNLRNFILKPQSVLNISNETYKVNSDEYIVVETDLTDKDYFADMIPYYSNQYVNGISHTMANPDPKISQKYLNEVSLEEQMAAGSELLEIINRCKSTNMAKNPKDVEGHPVTNYWRRWVFPRDKTRKIREIYFKNSPECSFGSLIYILQDYFKELFTEDRVRNMIWEGYSKLIEAGLLDKILNIFEIQGKKLIADSIRRGHQFKEIVLESQNYFLTIMDIWVVAYTYRVPIIAFSSMKELSGMGISVLEDPLAPVGELPNSWIVMGGSSENRFFYFVRSPSIIYGTKVDVIPEIQVIFGALAINELNKLEPLLQSALLRLEYVQRIQGPEYFLRRFNLRKK